MKNLNNIIFLSISTIITGAINYLYHPLMLRFLDIKTFGEFESLVSVFNILGVLVGGISFFLLKEISKNAKNLTKIKSIFIYSNKFLLLLSIGIYLIFLLFSPFLSSFLKIEDLLPLNIVGFTIIISFLSVVINPILQGLEKFKVQAFFSALGGVIKFIFGIFFVYLGFGLYGAIFGFIISGVLVFGFSFTYIYNFFKNINVSPEIIKEVKKDFKKDYKDVIHSFLLIFALSFYMNLDIILAKNIFGDDISGMYAGISVVSKFLIFLAGTIETVYYPQIVRSGKIFFHFIRNASGMIFLLGVGSLGFFYLFGEIFLDLLKPGFGEYNQILLVSLIYYSIYGFLSFFAKVLIGFRKYFINYLLFGGLVLIFFLTRYFTNGNIYMFLYFFIGTGFFLIFLLFFIIFKNIYSNENIIK